MPSTAIDSQIHGFLFSTDEMREIFSDRSWAQKWLDTEAALAAAQAELGIIPQEKADIIVKHADADLLDIREAVLERPLSDELGRPAGDVCIRFSMIRTGSADGAPPIAWTTEYVRRDWIELIRAAKDFPHLLMIELIERLFRKHCTEVRQVIEARALPEEGARHLNAATGSPALQIVRNYVDESGEILLSTVSYHPGDRYAFNLNARVPEHKRNERLDETLFDRLRNGSWVNNHFDIKI